MQKKVRNAGIIALAAGLLAIPVARYIMRRMNEGKNEGDSSESRPKRLFGAYRGHHKPHHRKAPANGQAH